MNEWYPELTARAVSCVNGDIGEMGYMYDDSWPSDEEKQRMIAENLSRVVSGAFAREYSDIHSVVIGNILKNICANAPAIAAECIKLPLDSYSIIIMSPDKSLVAIIGERCNLSPYERYYRAQLSVNFRTSDPPTVVARYGATVDLLARVQQNSLLQGTEITCKACGVHVNSGWFQLCVQYDTNIAGEINSVSWKEKSPGVFQQIEYGWKRIITFRGLAGGFGFVDPRKIAKWNDEILRVFDIIKAAKNILPLPIFEAFFEFFWQ